uniref:Uncharacterized protein n=1 Tax=Knipowitschia caucasica TaxID=637954 RepID=A0AAV2MHG5_KNICA
MKLGDCCSSQGSVAKSVQAPWWLRPDPCCPKVVLSRKLSPSPAIPPGPLLPPPTPVLSRVGAKSMMAVGHKEHVGLIRLGPGATGCSDRILELSVYVMLCSRSVSIEVKTNKCLLQGQTDGSWSEGTRRSAGATGGLECLCVSDCLQFP